jgi:hypothetical protein
MIPGDLQIYPTLHLGILQLRHDYLKRGLPAGSQVFLVIVGYSYVSIPIFFLNIKQLYHNFFFKKH